MVTLPNSHGWDVLDQGLMSVRCAPVCDRLEQRKAGSLSSSSDKPRLHAGGCDGSCHRERFFCAAIW